MSKTDAENKGVPDGAPEGVLDRELSDASRRVDEAIARRRELEAQKWKTTELPRLKSFVGHTFVYRNNSKGGTERWDTFKKVLAVQERVCSGAYVIYEECDVNSEGIARLQLDIQFVWSGKGPTDNNWTPCEPSEYEQARAATLAEIDNPLRAIQHIIERGY